MRAVSVILVLLALGGCTAAATAPAALPPLAGAEGLSLLSTGKSLTDHYVSFRTGKNCSTVRKEQGLSYCVEDEEGPPQDIYCYRTLGRVNCYTVPKPYGEDRPTVGHAVSGPVR